jgi:predicted CXXCH cytochrome family protein
MRTVPLSNLCRDRQWRRVLVTMLAMVVLAACRDDRIVYRDRAPFNTPADSTHGFLGYYDVSTKQTTCGNCHSLKQRDWKQTKHANATAALEASPGKQDYCYDCHTLTGNGNAASGSVAGHALVATNTYRDVQCESCHGAGLNHVEGVGQASLVRPLARLTMGGAGTCGDCHSGEHQPFAEEWAASQHANINTQRVTNTTCQPCHEGRAVLARFGVRANYVERDMPTAYAPPATCAVCHDPHGSPNSAQLRFSITSANPEENLCMQCHMRRAEPELTQSSPHAPQGAVLLGIAGWRPPGFAYDTARIFGSHATTLNPRLCAGCHVNRFTVTDKLTGAFTFQATGHLMRPIPCLDANGKPTADKTCAYTTSARTFASCAKAGCHSSQEVAANLFATVRARMKFYADILWVDANASGSMQAAPTDAGLLPTVRQTRPAEWSTTDNVITPAEGAEFNARLCGEYGQSNSDNSKGVHNPFLCEALLVATVNYIRTYYNLPATGPALEQRLGEPVGGPYHSAMRVSRTPPGQ